MRPREHLARNRANLALLACSVLAALALSEAGYRVLLARAVRRPPPEEVSFSVQDKSCWEYDARLGFRHKPGVTVDWTEIRGGLPALTGTLAIDSRGNSGPEVDDAGAELRIAVAGDSFTQIQHEGVTWPHLLQQRLRERTGRTVAVYNFAKDGYGVLQMIDQAAELVDGPYDLILVAFISPDLFRARFWRMEVPTADGVEVFTSTTPELRLDEPETFTRTTLLDARATRAWAERTRARGDREDPVLRSLVDRYLRERDNHAITRFDPFSLRTSYLWQRLARPRVRPLGTANLEFNFTNFASDRQFMDRIRKIRRGRVPVVLVHLAWYPDLYKGGYDVTEDEARLLESLKVISRFPYVTTLPGMPMGTHADILVLSQDNPHPSVKGLRYYAESVARGLAEARVLPAAGPFRPLPRPGVDPS